MIRARTEAMVLNVHNSFTLIIEKKNKNTYISWFTVNRIES